MLFRGGFIKIEINIVLQICFEIPIFVCGEHDCCGTLINCELRIGKNDLRTDRMNLEKNTFIDSFTSFTLCFLSISIIFPIKKF